ncbi:MAG: mechanosensitive ion channel family protein [Aigarchaeota archaeon]|nr:mechanosensitive ion channel family protein [Aigarchaeota archaeon]MDH5704304.1 mechanosensitive ion channel family protein [Aigarchaeota archaeon]
MLSIGLGQVPGLDWLSDFVGRQTLIDALIALLVFLLTYITAAVYSRGLSKISPKISKTRSRKGELLGVIVIWMIGLGILMTYFRVPPSQAVLLYAVALGGLIVAFRDVLTSIAAKKMLDESGAMKVGDLVRIGKYYGKVEKIGSLYTTITTLNFLEVHIPNSELLEREIENESQSPTALMSIPITVNANELNMNDVKLLMMKAARIAKRELAPGRVTEIRFLDISGNLVTLELRLHILSPAKRDALASLIREKIYQKLQEIGRN